MKNKRKMIHLQRWFLWAKRYHRHSILVKRIAQIYEWKLKIHMVGENFMLNLPKMEEEINNRCYNFQRQYSILRAL
jgi:hypothetical protein